MSKLNPNAGEWVPTFSATVASPSNSLSPVKTHAPTSQDQTPVQNETELLAKSGVNMSVYRKTTLERTIEFGRGISSNNNEESISYEGYSPLHNRYIYSRDYLLKFQPLGDRVLKFIPDVVKNFTPPKKVGNKVKGTLVYTKSDLLQFQPLYEMMPENFTWADTIGADAVMGENKGRKGKKDKFRQRAGVMPSLVCYFNPTEYATAMNMGLYTGPPADEQVNGLDGNSKLSVSEPVNPVEEAIIAKRRISTLLDDVQSTTVSLLLEAFMGITISCIHTLQEIVGFLFDRAIAHPDLSDSYAKLCTGMSERMPEFKDGAKTINFRRILLTKCYESLIEEPSSPSTNFYNAQKIGSGGETQHSWRRKCMLQNVGLIGELFRRQLLTENIMHVSVAMMLDDEANPQAEIIEAACGLLNLVGDLLDGSSPASRRTMDEYFAVLTRIYENCQLPDSVKKMINDLKTVRASGWIKNRQEHTSVSSPPVAKDSEKTESNTLSCNGH
ncbi:hypothetical protein, variant 1 [Plasmopara halstedii]|uniref:MIF4G domain-containing protein n=1 Tax=Plasmopara halstedii TaxID=4781 RepID=A0A0P1APJ7_PLAHL|nr:hypothetical protein, variant 1 [Plasmopara halstedii]CEG43129.1 hypothetical protein, variant 1 [Plasmopara halstedii]|eukprot:XP_024579498.1 hypothetical protein, variant 1 [Plasmopara halstedii]